MRDHGEPAQAEQVRAAVGVRVEPRAQPPRGRPDQQPAELAAWRSPRSPRAARRAARRRRPRAAFSVTFPVKPSVTKTSAAPRSRSRPSAFPAKSIPAASRSSVVRLERELVALLRLLADREQAHARAARRRGSPARRPSPSTRTGAGARAGCRRSRRRRSAPRRRSRVGSGTAIAGRSTPGSRRRWSRPAASIAPVFPAETTASAPPSATARTAATSDESGFAAHGLGRLLGHLDPVRRDRRARARRCRGRRGRTARRRCRRRPPRARLRRPRRERGPRRARRQRSAGSRRYGARKRSGSTSRPL